MSDIVGTVYAGLISKLKADVTLCNYVGGTLSPRIYNKDVPDAPTYPYVEMNLQADGPMNVNPTSLIDYVFFIRVWTKANDASARTIFALVDADLDNTVVAVSGSNSLWCRKETDMDRMEGLENNRLFMRGALFRITIN